MGLKETEFWRGVVYEGPLCLSKVQWDFIRAKLDETEVHVFNSFIGTLEAQAKWILDAKQEAYSEEARILRVGDSMRRAGLRSYTDKEGRIFVAPDYR